MSTRTKSARKRLTKVWEVQHALYTCTVLARMCNTSNASQCVWAIRNYTECVHGPLEVWCDKRRSMIHIHMYIYPAQEAAGSTTPQSVRLTSLNFLQNLRLVIGRRSIKRIILGSQLSPNTKVDILVAHSPLINHMHFHEIDVFIKGQRLNYMGVVHCCYVQSTKCYIS